MERVLILLLILGVVIVLGVVLGIYGNIAEPFVLHAERKPTTRNITGRYSDMKGDGNGFYHCRREDDTSEQNSNLPSCSEMRRGMIQNFREEGQIPEIAPSIRSKYPSSDENEVTGHIGSLQVILNRTASPDRHQMCVPFVDCSLYVNPKTKQLYCPVGMNHQMDSKGETIGCQSYPSNPMLYCSTNSEEGDGQIPCSVLKNIQTVGNGFELFPPLNIIQSRLQSRTNQDKKNNNNSQTTADKVIERKSQIIMNMIASYPNIVSKAEKVAGMYTETGGESMENINHLQSLKQYYDGVMQSYLLYQPDGTKGHRAGFIRSHLSMGFTDIRNLFKEYSYPSFEISRDQFIPDTTTLSKDIMPLLKPLHQSNYSQPQSMQPRTVQYTSPKNPYSEFL